jgi:hypothetical protein
MVKSYFYTVCKTEDGALQLQGLLRQKGKGSKSISLNSYIFQNKIKNYYTKKSQERYKDIKNLTRYISGRFQTEKVQVVEIWNHIKNINEHWIGDDLETFIN